MAALRCSQHVEAQCCRSIFQLLRGSCLEASDQPYLPSDSSESLRSNKETLVRNRAVQPTDNTRFGDVQHNRRARVLSSRHPALTKRHEVCRGAYSTHSRRLSTASCTRGVFIALGSNVGDSVKHIETACDAIEQDSDMHIVDTSCLYRTKPMYVEDQDDFVNGACEIETTLEPLALLDRLQAIEKELGRFKTIDKGPRNIDLDIIGYADRKVKTERLTIPHALMHERSFVLRPLNNLRQGTEWRLPSSGLTVQEHLAKMGTAMPTLTPLGLGGRSLDATKADGRTVLMSILNVTPDSFSDGGKNFGRELEALRQVVEAHIDGGAQIIDIGGQSSRPNAVDISAKEEISRVLPAIEAIRSAKHGDKIAISIDTYRAEVAEAAVNAGAHIVNDISGGLLDPEMLPTIARLGCTYVLMHMRGTPATMSSSANCTYANGVVSDVADELRTRLDVALDAGIRRWRIVLDPGLGFAKDTTDNLELLRSFETLRRHPAFEGIPWLVGSSRKRFIGQVTGVDTAEDRSWGTAATVTAAIAGGAHIVRVHDVREMDAVMRMSDAIYASLTSG